MLREHGQLLLIKAIKKNKIKLKVKDVVKNRLETERYEKGVFASNKGFNESLHSERSEYQSMK